MGSNPEAKERQYVFLKFFVLLLVVSCLFNVSGLSLSLFVSHSHFHRHS